MISTEMKSSHNGWNEIALQIQTELESYRRELEVIDNKIDQSRLEVNKLAQKNVSISSKLQILQSNLEQTSRADLCQIYDSSLDTQQRLFQMRGQVEKLTSDHDHLVKYIDLLERVLTHFEASVPNGNLNKGKRNAGHTVEMMIQSLEAERLRLSRQMHDGPAQALSNFILQTEIAMRLFSKDIEKSHQELENLKVSAMNTFNKVRDFIFELRPMMLDDLGLVPTIKRYLEILKERSEVDIQVKITGKERRLESYKEVMLFRAIQELANNTIYHSRASILKVQVDIGETVVKVTLDDDGIGFDQESLEDNPGMGLKVLRDRVEMLAGNIVIDSRIGQGTVIVFEIPASENLVVG
jgi:two-component system, NarL family, sensor histidine kinase DegS